MKQEKKVQIVADFNSYYKRGNSTLKDALEAVAKKNNCSPDFIYKIINEIEKGKRVDALIQGKSFEQLTDENPELLSQLDKENPETFEKLFDEYKKRNKI